MYPEEYKCTNAETPVTTHNITTVKESKRNPQSTMNSPLEIQLDKTKTQGLFEIPTS